MTPRRRLLLVAVVVVGCLLFAGLAYAQMPGAVDAACKGNGIYDKVLCKYRTNSARWAHDINLAASWLFWTLTAISMVWTFGMHALRRGDIMEVLAELIRFVMFVGFFYFLLDQGVYIGETIINSLRILAGRAGGVQNALSPTGIVDVGFEVFYHALARGAELGLFDAFAGFAMGLFILLVLATVALDMLVLLVAAWFLLYAGSFFLGFGGSKWTSDMAIGYFRLVLSIAVQTFAMILLVAVGKGIIDEVYTGADDESFLATCGILLTVSYGLYKLTSRIPPLLGQLVIGTHAGAVSASGTGMAEVLTIASSEAARAAFAMGGTVITAGAVGAAGMVQAVRASTAVASGAQTGAAGAGGAATSGSAPSSPLGAAFGDAPRRGSGNGAAASSGPARGATGVGGPAQGGSASEAGDNAAKPTKEASAARNGQGAGAPDKASSARANGKPATGAAGQPQTDDAGVASTRAGAQAQRSKPTVGGRDSGNTSARNGGGDAEQETASAAAGDDAATDRAVASTEPRGEAADEAAGSESSEATVAAQENGASTAPRGATSPSDTAARAGHAANAQAGSEADAKHESTSTAAASSTSGGAQPTAAEGSTSQPSTPDAAPSSTAPSSTEGGKPADAHAATGAAATATGQAAQTQPGGGAPSVGASGGAGSASTGAANSSGAGSPADAGASNTVAAAASPAAAQTTAPRAMDIFAAAAKQQAKQAIAAAKASAKARVANTVGGRMAQSILQSHGASGAPTKAGEPPSPAEIADFRDGAGSIGPAGIDSSEGAGESAAAPAQPSGAGRHLPTLEDPNGWVAGGNEPMSPKQANYLASLCKQAGRAFDPTMTRGAATQLVSELRGGHQATGLAADAPMTSGQASFLSRLCAQAGREFDPELTVAEASDLISELRDGHAPTGMRADPGEDV